MRRTAKHQAGMVSFNDFSGGINISSPGDLIAPNEMQVCQNFYFFANQRSLVPRGGLSKPLTTVGSDIVATFYDIDSNTYLVFDDAGNIYRVDKLGGMAINVGTLTGKKKPSCVKFQNRIWIASGEKLQYYDPANAATYTVLDAPVCDLVFQRLARLCVCMTGSDRITYSAVGDGESWDTDDNDASTGQWIDIGYGDSGDIIAVVPLATDLMIIKNNGMIYQLTGDADPASWAVYRVATETDPTGRQAAVPIGNDAVFMSRVGLRTLSTTMDYGNIATGDIGQKFSQLVVQSQFDPQLFNLRRHKLLIIRPKEDARYLVAYNYALGAATTLAFPIPITSITETLDKVVIASGNALYKLDDTLSDDSGTAIDFAIQLKDTVSTNQIILRSVDTDSASDHAGDIAVDIDDVKLTMPTNRRRKVRCNHTTPYMQVRLSGHAPFILKHVMLEVADL